MIFESIQRIGTTGINPQRATQTRDGDKVVSTGIRLRPRTLWPGGPTVIDTENLQHDQLEAAQQAWPDKTVERVTEKKGKDGSTEKETSFVTVSVWKESLEKWLLASPRRWRVIDKMPARKVAITITSDQLDQLDKAGISYTAPQQADVPQVHHGARTVGKRN